ncbi:uncharacterized protein LOC127858601 [Dreissena polymorpha]|uniref:Uncharacterized protein n=1 Tax=Dreissena polymorpha TaxID=45954 RepID=A0A9D3Z282_DREPO|nr:uncharacterized protein LOC127858601 [Dreissena polymorpha]XP_052251761.1 uncharacterized protein LOC127858601 [Dreissena polymorpha]KAH3709556.1 hypothetical protein DPMN_069020 [Dreissena polymorpha]
MEVNPGPPSQCYCCERVTPSLMDIDAALNELGMLSSVTDSRRQYLQERGRTRSESAILTKHSSRPKAHSLPVSSSMSNYHILHIDTKYVTGFSDTQTRVNSSNEAGSSHEPDQRNDEVFVDHSKEYRNPREDIDSSIENNRRTRMMRMKHRQTDFSARSRRMLARKRAQQPYEVPWRLTQSFQEGLLLKPNDPQESKSNSSSPVKPINPESLPRSRSLDNLDFSSFFISGSLERPDIDNVASGIKNLNVSDT